MISYPIPILIMAIALMGAGAIGIVISFFIVTSPFYDDSSVSGPKAAAALEDTFERSHKKNSTNLSCCIFKAFRNMAEVEDECDIFDSVFARLDSLSEQN